MACYANEGETWGGCIYPNRETYDECGAFVSFETTLDGGNENPNFVAAALIEWSQEPCICGAPTFFALCTDDDCPTKGNDNAA